MSHFFRNVMLEYSYCTGLYCKTHYSLRVIINNSYFCYMVPHSFLQSSDMLVIFSTVPWVSLLRVSNILLLICLSVYCIKKNLAISGNNIELNIPLIIILSWILLLSHLIPLHLRFIFLNPHSTTLPHFCNFSLEIYIFLSHLLDHEPKPRKYLATTQAHYSGKSLNVPLWFLFPSSVLYYRCVL